MQELDYNPSRKDLTDARIHHLLAEELKPRRVSAEEVFGGCTVAGNSFLFFFVLPFVVISDRIHSLVYYHRPLICLYVFLYLFLVLFRVGRASLCELLAISIDI